MFTSSSPWGSKKESAALMKSFAEVAKLIGKMGGSASGGENQYRSKGWYCNCKDCNYGIKSILNWPERTCCWGCKRSKAAALSPPASIAIKLNDPKFQDKTTMKGDVNSIDAKTLKKREARTKKRSLRREQQSTGSQEHAGPVTPSPAPASAPTVAPDPDPEKDRTQRKHLQLPEELREELPEATLDALKEVLDSLLAETVPTDFDEASAEETFKKFLGEKGPSAKCEKRKRLMEQIASLNTVLGPMKVSGITSVIELTQKEITEKEAELAKLEKSAPSQDSELKSAEEAKAHFLSRNQTRKDFAKAGGLKAQERDLSRAGVFAKLRDDITKVELKVKKLVEENAEKFRLKLQATTKHEEEVVKLFDDKILSLSQNAVQPHLQALQALAPPDGPLVLNDLKDLQAAEDKCARMEKEMAVMKAAMANARSQALTEFERSVDVTAADLPIADMPSKDNLHAYGTLYQALRQWNEAGQAVPFDWGAVHLKSVGADGPSAPFIIKSLLGSIWTKFYTNDPEASHVVPRQLATITFNVLNSIKIVHESKEAEELVQKAAMESYVLIKESGKRLRSA